MNIKENVPLAPLTTFKVGGPARYFAGTTTVEEIKEAVSFAHGKKVPFFILGGGSNILVSDSGFRGLVIKISSRGITYKKDGKNILVEASAGESWDDFVKFAVARGWRGVENLSGVPGNAGAAPVQNIGCYGTEVKDVVESVIAFDTKEEKTKTFSNEECEFGYRSSLFKKPEGKKYIILSVTFRLSDAPYRQSGETYKDSRFDIGELLKKRTNFPTLEDVRDIILGVREGKGMVIMEGRESYNSAGSFFAAPVVPRLVFEEIAQTAKSLSKEKEENLRPWFWKTGENNVKIAPAFLLEFTRFNKGYRRGNAGISPKHSLSLINAGGAKAREIHTLADEMQNEVKKIFGIDLIPEVLLVGDF